MSGLVCPQCGETLDPDGVCQRCEATTGPVTMAYARDASRKGTSILALLGIAGALIGSTVAPRLMSVTILLLLAFCVPIVWARGQRLRALMWIVGLWTTGVLVMLWLDSRPRRTYGTPPGIKCMMHLRKIGRAVAMYRMENNDAYPPDLKALVYTHFVTDHGLECPGEAKRNGPDYFYNQPAGPPAPAPPSHAILACDFRDNHDYDVRYVLFHSGRADDFREPDFQALLKRPENADFAKALRAVEGP